MQADQFGRELPHSIAVAGTPAKVDGDVATLAPPQLLEPGPQPCDVGLRFAIALGQPHQYADPPLVVALLRMRGQRPSG